MSTFANSLKAEIARIARKELKDELAALRKSASLHRSEIAALKRDVKALSQQLGKQARGLAAPAKSVQLVTTSHKTNKTFDAKKLAEYRAHLGVTQAQLAKLLQASSLSVYKWESGKVQPRTAQLERINAILKLGKRAALRELETLAH
jgi:DNA-binding transcriptional regulator YiaG